MSKETDGKIFTQDRGENLANKNFCNFFSLKGYHHKGIYVQVLIQRLMSVYDWGYKNIGIYKYISIYITSRLVCSHRSKSTYLEML